MRIDVRTEHEVTGLDLSARKAEVHNRAHGRTFQLGFDQLHLATGALPRRPDLPGLNLPHVHGVQTLGDAERVARRHEGGGGDPSSGGRDRKRLHRAGDGGGLRRAGRRR